MSAYAQTTDDCSQYPTCEICLNVSDTGSTRQFCSWCHVDVTYNSGGIGKQCVDIRDQPWKCPSTLNTYECTPGYLCNFATGQCALAPPGQGFPDAASCQQHCFVTPNTYICNTTSYTCDICADSSAPGCADQATACAGCSAPTNSSYKCVGTGDQAVCNLCSAGESDCTTFAKACYNCGPKPTAPPSPPTTPTTPSPPTPPTPSPPTPPTPPPTPPPSPAPPKQYTCDEATFTCTEGTGPLQSCTQCSNSTPSELVGVWRGFAAQAGFVQGEWTYVFAATTAVIEDVTGTIVHADVSINGNPRLTYTDGPDAGHYREFLQLGMSNGPETVSAALVFGPLDSPAPESITVGMAGNGDWVHIVSECASWKSDCKFTAPMFDTIQTMLAANFRPGTLSEKPKSRRGGMPLLRFTPVAAAAPKAVPAKELAVAHPLGTSDPCNAFPTCTTCINADPKNGILCGWCLGADVIYNGTGPSQFQCAGYQSGSPYLFTCPSDFLTENCAGWSCNYTAVPEPTCVFSEAGEYPSQAQCQVDCVPATFAKCNVQTKQCEPCTQGSVNCTQTQAECEQVCAAAHAKCNTVTNQCESCDPASDPKCTQTAGSCATSCKSQNFGICNPTTGTCASCQQGAPGCIAQCNSTCSKQTNYGCDKTDPQNPVCTAGTGNNTLSACAAYCKPPLPTTTASPTPPPPPATTTAANNYGCVYTNPNSPVCVQGKGTDSKSDCLTNCVPPAYAKCNYTSGLCNSCTPGASDPDCKYTQGYCQASCKQIDATGNYRGNQINAQYTRGEYDFSFYPDGTVAFWLFATPEVKYVASFTQGGQVSEGSSIVFTLTKAPAGGPLAMKVGDVLSGLFLDINDEEDVTAFLYLGLGAPNAPATSFDMAMTTFEWVLVKCRGTDIPCDFTPAAVPE